MSRTPRGIEFSVEPSARRRVGPWRWAALLALAAALVPIGCGTALNRQHAGNPPLIRVRLLSATEQAYLLATDPPTYKTTSDPVPRTLGLQSGRPVQVSLTPAGWRLGNTTIGTGELVITPVVEGTLSVGSQPGTVQPYRGRYRLVPNGANKFDVVNDVDVDGYLAGVLPRELMHNWQDETYKAQAVVARTYALYEKGVSPAGRSWDVYPDDRSQMYGGIAAETDRSRRAVNDTAGIVLAYAPPGEQPRIFKAYFSSCCGGISQSVTDGFGEPFIEPLADRNNRATCNASPRFSWGPVVIPKRELTRRFHAWGTRTKRPERDMADVTDVSIQGTNGWGRPTRFVVTDAKQRLYSLSAEEFRTACNCDAPRTPEGAAKDTLYSSFVKVITDSDSIRFVEGHGWGHGVGLCQWCAQRCAEERMRHEDIVLAAYPHARLVRAY